MRIINAEITIAIGQFENIKPQIAIDLDNLEQAQKDICLLWDAFHNIVEYRSTSREGDTESFNTIETETVQLPINNATPQNDSPKKLDSSKK